MKKQTVDDHCIRHEGKYRNVGVYVVVVMDGVRVWGKLRLSWLCAEDVLFGHIFLAMCHL